jgi:hypothetical protein
MTELPLDDYQRDPFAGRLDCYTQSPARAGR